jgi:hypothetical protein
MTRRLAIALLAAGVAATLGGCLVPPGAAERATDAARDLNLAARFGRMDIAVIRTATAARAAFIARHASWGKTLRILDVEMAGITLPDPANAVVLVDVTWMPFNESTTRITRVAQFWHDEREGWQLVREKQVAGELGLFGEPIEPRLQLKPAQFATTVIR